LLCSQTHAFSTYRHISTDDLCLSEHDRRILESMALKKEIERESDEFAYQARQLWEQDREEREQVHIYIYNLANICNSLMGKLCTAQQQTVKSHC